MYLPTIHLMGEFLQAAFFNSLPKPRAYIYDYYHPLTNSGNNSLRMWVQNSTYKLYGLTDKFYNMAKRSTKKIKD